MADGRNGHGGARQGSGRKPKADEIRVVESMDAIMAPDAVWQCLAGLVSKGDVQAVKTWLGYRFGMPKQAVDMNATITEFPAPIIELPNE